MSAAVIIIIGLCDVAVAAVAFNIVRALYAPGRPKRRRNTYCLWARSEAAAAELQRLGWTPSTRSAETHHANFALLHTWEGAGEPPMPEGWR